ncbi:MAG: hypothetical protein L3K26_14040, partial [Candidatus Hydrogenedentes bacterium]|nr:hypothetical protein [Candidatus Hydrogenedentota bacterium]
MSHCRYKMRYKGATRTRRSEAGELTGVEYLDKQLCQQERLDWVSARLFLGLHDGQEVFCEPAPANLAGDRLR